MRIARLDIEARTGGRVRRLLLLGLSLLGFNAGIAQDTAAPHLEEVAITGTRIACEGFTPFNFGTLVSIAMVGRDGLQPQFVPTAVPMERDAYSAAQAGNLP